jgi:Glycosyltransferase
MMSDIEQTNDFTAGKLPSAPSVKSRVLRVLIVAPAEPLIGGQAVQALRLCEKLSAEDFLQIRLQPINPQLPPIFRKLQQPKYLRTFVTSIAYIFALLTQIPFYDIVHVFSAGDTSFVLATTPAVLVAKLFRKKTILNYRHGGAEEHFLKWRRTALPTARLFDRIVVPSGFLVEVFGKFGFSAEAIYNFVNTESYRFRLRNPLRPIFLSNRNFEPLYNVGCILRAFRIIQNRFPEARLIVAGDGEERAKLEKLARELDLKGVEFVGRVPQKEMPALYEQSDIYLNSPNIDNMPGSIIEAFAAGSVVVSTDVGGIPFVVQDGETGFLVGTNDHRAMAEKAIFLLENPEVARTVTENARREVEKYSWRSVREKWLALYSQISEEK